MTERERKHHEDYLEKISELLADDSRIVVGLATNQYEGEDDISSITIQLAPSGGDE